MEDKWDVVVIGVVLGGLTAGPDLLSGWFCASTILK